jgi:nucleoside-diphosphate-sugar epimerase
MKYDPEICKCQYRVRPNRAGDIPHSLPGIDKARIAGVRARVFLKEGLEEAVDWYIEEPSLVS